MENNISLIDINDPKNMVEFLQQPAIKLAEFITGILISESKDWKLSAGHLIQASIKGNLFKQLGKEIRDYIDKGKIREDFLEKDINKQSLSDLLKFIDEESPSEDRFEAIKKLFFKTIMNDSIDEEQALSYQLIHICKKLESEHLLILKSAYEIKQGIIRNNSKPESLQIQGLTSATEWVKIISVQIGHGISSLVEIGEEKLINLKLISPRTYSDKSGIRNSSNFRLTDLGIKFCEYVYKD